MAKTLTAEQHAMLHQYWPNDCRLCTHEDHIRRLKAENERLRVLLRLFAEAYPDEIEGHHFWKLEGAFVCGCTEPGDRTCPWCQARAALEKT